MARARSNDYDDKRLLILDTAAALFAEHGFANTSVAMLSQRSGGSKAWVYHYYDSKEAILFDLLLGHVQTLLAVVQRANSPDLAPRARLHGLVVGLLHAYRAADDRHAVQINDLGRLPRAQQQQIKAVERQMVDVFAAALLAVEPRLAGQPGVLKPLTMSLLGMLNWHHRWFRPDGLLSLPEYAAMVVTLVCEGLPGVRSPDHPHDAPRTNPPATQPTPG